MPRLHMTDVMVSRLKAAGTYYDETTPAFGLRVGKNRKTWFVIRGRERLRTNIGRYPQTKLADARKQAKRLLNEVPAQGDRLKFDEAYERYKEAIATKKPRTQLDYKRMMEKYFLPRVGKKRLPDITYEELTAITKGLRPSEGAHALAVARTFFRWCVRPPRRYIPHSPLEGLQVITGKPRKRVLKDDELGKVWKAAEKQSYPYGTLVQLLVLTGQRRGEIVALRWPWINQKDQTITLPDWLTKNGKEHTFPYNGRVAMILETIPRLNSTDLLFPSKVSDERPISGWSKYKRELEDGVDGWTLHDLRRTFRTIHAKIGTPSSIGERLINHAAAVTTEVEQIYDIWTYLPEMRRATERFEEHLAAILAR